jgi:hypothetical protein
VTAEARKKVERELVKAIRASGRAHAKVAALCRRPRSEWRTWRTLSALGKAARRAALTDGRVGGFALMLAAERRRKARRA